MSVSPPLVAATANTEHPLNQYNRTTPDKCGFKHTNDGKRRSFDLGLDRVEKAHSISLSFSSGSIDLTDTSRTNRQKKRRQHDRRRGSQLNFKPFKPDELEQQPLSQQSQHQPQISQDTFEIIYHARGSSSIPNVDSIIKRNVKERLSTVTSKLGDNSTLKKVIEARHKRCETRFERNSCFYRWGKWLTDNPYGKTLKYVSSWMPFAIVIASLLGLIPAGNPALIALVAYIVLSGWNIALNTAMRYYQGDSWEMIGIKAILLDSMIYALAWVLPGFLEGALQIAGTGLLFLKLVYDTLALCLFNCLGDTTHALYYELIHAGYYYETMFNRWLSLDKLVTGELPEYWLVRYTRS